MCAIPITCWVHIQVFSDNCGCILTWFAGDVYLPWVCYPPPPPSLPYPNLGFPSENARILEVTKQNLFQGHTIFTLISLLHSTLGSAPQAQYGRDIRNCNCEWRFGRLQSKPKCISTTVCLMCLLLTWNNVPWDIIHSKTRVTSTHMQRSQTIWTLPPLHNQIPCRTCAKSEEWPCTIRYCQKHAIMCINNVHVSSHGKGHKNLAIMQE